MLIFTSYTTCNTILSWTAKSHMLSYNTSCNLEEKVETLQSELKDFTVLSSGYSASTPDEADHMKHMVEPQLEKLKMHCSSFDKVLIMSKTYLSTQ